MNPSITLRLALIQTPLDVLKTRLVRDSFIVTCTVAGRDVPVIFPAQWPGDAIVLFPMMIDSFIAEPETDTRIRTIIDRESGTAVGMIGCKGSPDAEGSIEIGYGINEDYWNRGYATESVSVFTDWLLSQPEITRVTAECCVDNIGSARILEKAGFLRTGFREDPEDGSLILWAMHAEAG